MRRSRPSHASRASCRRSANDHGVELKSPARIAAGSPSAWAIRERRPSAAVAAPGGMGQVRWTATTVKAPRAARETAPRRRRATVGGDRAAGDWAFSARIRVSSPARPGDPVRIGARESRHHLRALPGRSPPTPAHRRFGRGSIARSPTGSALCAHRLNWSSVNDRPSAARRWASRRGAATISPPSGRRRPARPAPPPPADAAARPRQASPTARARRASGDPERASKLSRHVQGVARRRPAGWPRRRRARARRPARQARRRNSMALRYPPARPAAKPVGLDARPPPLRLKPAPMELADFDFDLPPERIALRPAAPRDAARLLEVDADGRPRRPRSSPTCPGVCAPATPWCSTTRG